MSITEKEKIWRWNANLAWELFSAGIYNYRLALVESKEHKKHAFCKNSIFDIVTSVEAHCNEILAKEKSYSEQDLQKISIVDKLKVLGIDYEKSKYKESKNIRNNFLVHHKRNDQRYFEEINQFSALDAIEAAQAVFEELSFNRNIIFPYWITGLNFINPSSGKDIWLMNNYEFWCRFKWLNISDTINSMVLTSGQIVHPTDEATYKSLYLDIWNHLKKNNFKLEILNTLKSSRFPRMPFLTAEWWAT